jgi:hypothetical protein
MSHNEMLNAAFEIRKANLIANQGRGSSTARNICNDLEKGDLKGALKWIDYDGDKLRQYPDLNRVIEGYLGCRTHHIVGCTHKRCQHG